MDKIHITRARVGVDGKINSAAAADIRDHVSTLAPGTETLISITPFKSIAGGLDILPIEKILEDLKSLDTLSRIHVEPDAVNQVIDLLNEISEWIPYAGRIQANCKYYLRAAESNLFDNIPEHILKLSTTERTRWLKAQCAEFEALYEQAERVVSAMTHRCEHLRTFVSYEKAMAQLGNFPQSKDEPKNGK